MAIVMELGRDEITAAWTDGQRTDMGQREMGPHRARSPFSARGNEKTAAERTKEDEREEIYGD